MAYLPYLTRHVQRTVEDVVRGALDALGWLGPVDAVPFGATPFTFQRGRMIESELRTATGNLVSVSFGFEPDDAPLEMGGGLLLVEYVTFIDVLGESDSIALSLASDVKDRLSGRVPGGGIRVVALTNYATEPPSPQADYRLEFTAVTRQEGDPSVVRNWHIVKATVELVYVGED